MMENGAAKELLLRYQQGNCTEAEKALLERWYLQFNEPENDIDVDPERVENLLEEVYAKLPGHDKSTFKVIRFLSIIGAIAAMMLIAFGLFILKIHKEPAQAPLYSSDIVPGTNKAILTLANGKKINLSNTKTGVVIAANKLTYNDGSEITGDSTGAQTISTPKGGQYQIVLPDGSKVWLNAATTLKFPQSFNGLAKRKVELSGEAYFEVAKDKAHSFIVKSKSQQLEVLGTHFNIYAYEDEPTIKSTLLEGRIKIDGNTLLQPGEQAVNAAGKIHVDQVDTDIALAWKNGEFMFQKESLESIMRKISRWYNVEVVYVDQQQAKKLFGGTISRFTNVSEVLNMLQLTGQVHFKIEGRRIRVLK